jgi:hypothetical protein
MKDNALYLEVDEDITSAIDKLQKLTADSVQIVVPKRSTMLQSIINLKLLKKAAADSGKELVLVTNDRIATDLAGRVGLAVAPSLGAEAVMASRAEQAPSTADEVIEADDPEPELDPAAVAPAAAATTEQAAKPAFKLPRFARREVGDKPAVPAGAAATSKAATDAPADGSSTGPKVPNFNQMRKRLLWIGAAASLIVVYLVAMYFLASAKVTLYASGNKIDIDLTFTADPDLKQTDVEKGVLAAQAVTLSKDLTGPITPTGKKDVGTKAGGTITVSNGMGVEQTLVAGTQFAAPSGRIFRSNGEIVVPAAHLNSGGDKVNGQASVAVTADQAGDMFNEAPAAYTIPKLNNPKVTAQGGQMSGGTSKTITVVTQADIDKAKAEIIEKDKEDGQRALEGRVPSGYTGLKASSQQKVDSATANPGLDQEATAATLTLKVTYTELAVKQTEYQELVRAQEQEQIGDDNQIYKDGLGQAEVTMTDQDRAGRAIFHLTTEAYGGAKLDQAALAKQLAGKKYGDAVDAASRVPGVQRAEVQLSPAWITSVPKRTSQVKVIIEVAEKDE